MTDPARIAVYGASGHTGRLVAAELVAQDQELVLVGRTGDALAAVAGEIGGRCRVRVAELDDAAALHAALSDTDAVVNCAGPFSRSSRPVALAAIANGAHHVDHAAEPLAVMNLFAELSAPARAAGVVVIPSMSFYGATADLLSALVSRDQAPTAEVTVAYAVNGWRMTTASKHTAALLAGTESVSYTHGAFTVGAGRATPRKFEFPAPIGIREVMTFPAGAEIVTIPRHGSAPSVQVLITTETFQEEFVYTSEELDAADRADSEFLLVVRGWPSRPRWTWPEVSPGSRAVSTARRRFSTRSSSSGASRGSVLSPSRSTPDRLCPPAESILRA
jgi:hypothetical protein